MRACFCATVILMGFLIRDRSGVLAGVFAIARDDED